MLYWLSKPWSTVPLRTAYFHNSDWLSFHPIFYMFQNTVLYVRKRHENPVRCFKLDSILQNICISEWFQTKHSILVKLSQNHYFWRLHPIMMASIIPFHSLRSSVLYKVYNSNADLMQLCFSEVFYSEVHRCRDEKANMKALSHPQDSNFQTQPWIVGSETIFNVPKLKFVLVELRVGGPRLPLSFLPRLSLVSI